MGMSNISKVLSVWERTLYRADIKTLNQILRNLDKWFRYDEDFDKEVVSQFKLVSKSKLKEPKVNFIMEVDPIAAEGGLLDFLHDQTVKGLIKRPKSFFTFTEKELEAPANEKVGQ